MPSKDLFDDTPMTIGEHLEALRGYLFKALIGAVIAIIFCLWQGKAIIAIMRQPIDEALTGYANVEDDLAGTRELSFWEWLQSSLGFGEAPETPPETDEVDEAVTPYINVELSAHQLLTALHAADPEQFPEPDEASRETKVTLPLAAPEFAEFKSARDRLNKPVSLNVQEAFMSYMKVSVIAGFVIASPWVFGQIWLFVASGLYRHERKLVYVYGGLSLLLFMVGAVFCFKLVFPHVLKFLLDFNKSLDVQPQIRLSEWLSFAVLLPVMFGLSFQLPLVMKFIHAINVVSVQTFREKRRIAIFVIAVISVVATPTGDPMSMLLMMFPLMLLYEVGIILCKYTESKNPFGTQAA
jgi:sec-independent protein translocase protein TatC